VSNFLAVATVTAALSQTIQEAVGPDVPGATVTTLQPHNNGNGTPAAAVNICLYQVTPNAAFINADLPIRRGSGELMQRPQTALDLYYLLTFYGDESQLEPQRLLGSVVRALHERPVITRDMIRQTIAKPAFSFLVNSNLADAVELVKLTPAPLSVEELSKLWSVYFQTPYSLSIAYQGSVVLIESDVTVQTALPVRARNLYVVPFRQPSIETVRSTDGSDAFIFAESTVVITGKRLRGEVTNLTIGGIDLTPDPEEVTDTQITVTLPGGLRAGVQGLQVVQSRLMGSPPAPHRGVESNLAAFVLHPRIEEKPDGTPDIDVSLPVVAADGTRSADVTVKLNPNVGKTQRAVFFMNELNPPSGSVAHAYSFDASPRNGPGDPAETDTLLFPITGVVQADYLVRVQVDGADSPLDRDPDESNPVYIGPKVTIN
jgi:hypothetical protein